MWQISNRLYQSFKAFTFQLIEEQSKKNRRGKGKNKLEEIDEQRVFNHPGKVHALKETDKMVKAGPWACEEAENGIVGFKGYDNAEHRYVVENKVIKNNRQSKKIQGLFPGYFCDHVMPNLLSFGGLLRDLISL